MLGGQLVVDNNGAIWLRGGERIMRITAMCEWDGKLVCGVGEYGSTAATKKFPNLVFLDKESYQEVQIFSGGVSTAGAIRSVWVSPIYGMDNPVRKKLTKLRFYYYSKSTHATGANTLVLYYRVDHGSWTDCGLSITPEQDDATHVVNIDKELELDGKLWEFKITSSIDFTVLGFEPFLRPEPPTQD